VKTIYQSIKTLLIGSILLFSTNGCAGILPIGSINPPRTSFTFLKKEVIYEICIDSKRASQQSLEEAPSHGSIRSDKTVITKTMLKNDCQEITSTSLASGVIVDHFISPETKKKASLVLTAGHFCQAPEPEIPKSIGSLMTPHITSAKVYWRYIAYDYTGEAHVVNKVIAKSGRTDMCLLEVKRIDQPPVTIAKVSPRYGDKILNIGTPYGLFIPPLITLDEGLYLGEGAGEGPILMSDLVIGPGSSGSMILQKQGLTWKLVGMIHSVILIYDPPVGVKDLVGEPLLSLGASLKQVTDFIKYANDTYIAPEGD